MTYAPAALVILVAFAILFIIGRRLAAMDSPATRRAVAAQYGCLVAGVLLGLVVPGEWGRLAIGAGVLGYLKLGSDHWRRGAPPDILKPEVAAARRRRSTDRLEGGIQ